MKKSILAALAICAVTAASASAAGVRVNDPTGKFSGAGGEGYVQVSDDGAQACNENKAATPLGDGFTGYAYISRSGNTPGTPTYGNDNVGAGDADGETDADPTNGAEEDDCPNAPAGTTVVDVN